MTISKQLQSTLNGNARSSGTFFDLEDDAKQAVEILKEAGHKNVRFSKFLNFTKQDGTKVYSWCVKFNA